MAAYLKFAATSILAAALLAAACSDGDSEPEPAATTTPPPPTATQSAPTPTPVPLGFVSPASTIGWLTYTSPFGFKLDFPEEWTLEESEVACCVPGGTQLSASFRLMNSVYEGAREPREFVPPPDAVQVKVVVHPRREDDGHSAATIIKDCETAEERQDILGVAERTLIAGLPATLCTGTHVFLNGRTLAFQNQWIELASGRTLVITTVRYELSALERSRVDTVLASLRFEDAP